MIDVKLTQRRGAMVPQEFQEAAAVKDAPEASQGQMGCKGALFGRKAGLRQASIERLLQLL
jgi:hypothetical protein